MRGFLRPQNKSLSTLEIWAVRFLPIAAAVVTFPTFRTGWQLRKNSDPSREFVRSV